MTGPRQYVFDLPVEPTFAASDFIPSRSNQLALDGLLHWMSEDSPILILVGPVASGKSHLLAVWRSRVHGVPIDPTTLASADPTLGTEAAQTLDDFDRLAGDLDAETALFHRVNATRNAGGKLLLTARNPVALWGLTLADLKSRLAAAPSYRIEEPDDLLLQAVMAKQFADRGVSVSPATLAYLVPRLERSFAAITDAVAGIDCLGLARGGRITRTVARDWLQAQGREGLEISGE